MTKDKGNKKLSNSNKAYEEIKRQIIDNKLSTSELVTVRQLGDQLGMSRTPIREALVRLEDEELIELIPKHGMRVLPISSNDMREIYWILMGLELVAIELIGEQKLLNKDFKVLSSLAKKMVKALNQDDLDKWSHADEEFHKQIVLLSGNSRLVNTVNSFRDQTHRARIISLRLRPKPVASSKEHLAVVEALKNGEIERAKHIHGEQWKRSRKQLTEILERFGIMKF